MMRYVLLGLVASLAGCKAAIVTPPTAPSTVVKWTSNGNPAAVPCAASAAPKNCIAGVSVVAATGQKCQAAATASSCTVQASGQITVRAMGYDKDGNAISSTAVTVQETETQK